MNPWLLLLIIPAVLVVLLLIALIKTLCTKKKTSWYEFSKDEARTDLYASKLSKMIQYETVSVMGVEQPEKFRGFHAVLEGLFPTVFSTCQKIDIDGNLLVKWKGKNPSLEPIILISHQDVVEASGKWDHDPFGGEIVDGKLYGRGSADIKCGVFAFYQAVEELIKEGYVPACDVYLGSSCTEEIGGDGAPKIVRWFQDQGIHLFMLSDEGGAIALDPVGGVKGAFAAVGVFEKGYGDIKVIAKGNGGHSSTPGKDTPIARLAAFEAKIERKTPFKSKFCPALETMFSSLAPYCSSFLLKYLFTNLWLFKPLLKVAIPKISAESAAMLRTTSCFTMQKGSDGTNVIPQEAWVVANLRYIPHQGKKESNKIFFALAEKHGLTCEWMNGNDYSKPFDLKGKAFEITKRCINEVFPTIGVMPYVVTGGTDSRFFDPVCDNCVRFSPILFTDEQLKGMHGLNENIYTHCLPGAVDYYKALIKAQESR